MYLYKAVIFSVSINGISLNSKFNNTQNLQRQLRMKKNPEVLRNYEYELVLYLSEGFFKFYNPMEILLLSKAY